MPLSRDMSEETARWTAAEANTTHGLPLKQTERREVFRVYMRIGRNQVGRGLKSYRDIAQELNGIVSKSSLQRWMAADFPKVAARMSPGAPANGPDESAGDGRSPYYEEAIAHLEQIKAVAPALKDNERRLVAEQLTEAASKVLTAGPWEAEEVPFEL